MSMLAALPIFGGMLSGVGQIRDSKEKSASLENEANIAEMNARQAREVGQYNARRQELETNQRIGAIEADVGASGISSDSGNVLDILRQTAVNSELDRQNILRGAELSARSAEYRATQARYGAKQVKGATRLNVMATMLGSAATAASRSGGGNGNIQENAYEGNNISDASSEYRGGNLKYDTERYYA